MVLGAVMLIDSPLPEMRIHLSTAHGGGAAVFRPSRVLLLSLVVRARRNKVETGAEGMIGEIGVRRDRRWRRRARSSCMANIGTRCRRGPVPAGARVRVTAITDCN